MGGILTGGYKFVTGGVEAMGGSSKRAALDETYRSKLSAADTGELETKQIAAEDAGRVRSAGTQTIAKQATAYTASGVDASQGTPLSVMADTRLMSELDARTLENNAARKVRGFREQKRQSEVEYRTRIAEQEQEGVNSMLSGIGDVAGGVMGFGG
jgi:hypothetical protein